MASCSMFSQKSNMCWGKLPRAFAFFNFFFPLGFFFPFAADLYIVSRTIKGHAISLWTGRPFKLDDELFSLQRTFALLEAQIESVKWFSFFHPCKRCCDTTPDRCQNGSRRLTILLRIVKKMFRLLPKPSVGGIPGPEAYQIKMIRSTSTLAP